MRNERLFFWEMKARREVEDDYNMYNVGLARGRTVVLINSTIPREIVRYY